MDNKELAPIIQKAFQKGLDNTKTRFGSVNATRSLRNSIKAAPITDGIEVSMNNYGLFINEGTRRSKYAGSVRREGGESEMITSLVTWIKAKGIRPRFGGKNPELSLAFAIRNKIWENGIRPNHWIDNVLDEMLNENGELYKYLQEKTAEEIEERIIEIFESIEGI